MRSDRRVGERGSAVVEFALVLPLLLLLVVAIVQVGVLVRARLILEQSARAGAREAAVESDEGTVRSTAEAAAPGLPAEDLTVEVQRDGARGDPVTVSVGYDVRVADLIAGWLMPESVHLGAEATMRQEFG
jgi:Flp pilus assembly protein TadG